MTQGLGSAGLKVQGSGLRTHDSGSRVSRAQGSGLRHVVWASSSSRSSSATAWLDLSVSKPQWSQCCLVMMGINMVEPRSQHQG